MVIDANKLRVFLDRQYHNCHGYIGNKKEIYREALLAVKSYIHREKQIDAEPVVHGKWVKMSDSDGDYYCCSNCGEELPRYSCTFPTPTKPFPLMKSIDKTNYCPHCGAKMDEVSE